MTRTRWATAGTMTVLGCLLASANVPAAEVGSQDTRTGAAAKGSLEEIIVVAQRREQALVDVPASISVFSEKLLQEANIQEAKGYLALTPNVTFQQGGRNGAREIVIAIRGISDIKGGEKIGIQSAFATYFDEFSVGTLASGHANPPTYDVQSIEILRGPQGTFFGRNAEGGAINIVTKKPERDFYGQVDFGFGRFDGYELDGIVNVPVTETLYARASLQSSKTNGPLRNRHPTGGDSGADFLAVRGQLRWLPTESTTVDLSLNHIDDRQDYTPKLATCIQPTFGFNPFSSAVLGGIGCYDPDGELRARISSDPAAPNHISLPPGVTLDSIRSNSDALYQNTREFTNNTTDIVIAHLAHDFGDSLRLTSVTGRTTSYQDQQLDLDKSGVDSVDRTGEFDAESWSTELRLASIGERKLDWTVGAIYSEDTFRATNQIHIKGFLGPWMRGDLANENVIHDALTGWAAFANLEWHVTDRLSLIAGGRYAHDTDDQRWTDVFAACPRRPVGAALDPGCELTPDQIANPIIQDDGGTLVTNGGRSAQTAGTSGKNSSNDFSPQIALRWKPAANIGTYISASQGYKGAGVRVNPDSGFEHVSLFGKEQLRNYEIGLNARLLDDRLAVQAAVFRMDWTDMQVEVRQSFCRVDRPGLPPILIPIEDFTGSNCLITPFDGVSNADKARSQGVEFSAQGLIGEHWQLGGALGYLDAKFITFIADVAGTPDDRSGERIGAAPRFTGSVYGRFDFPLLGGIGFVRGDYAYRSQSVLDISRRSDSAWPRETPAFGVANLQAGGEWGNQRLVLSVENAFGEDYFTGADGFSYGGTLIDFHPRTWFLRWTWFAN